MTEVDRLGWAVSVPLRAGGYVLGVRANTDEVGALLRELFADRVVDDADPPGNLSLLLAPPGDDGTQELHRLYVTYTRVLRSRSALRMLEAVWHELDVRDVEVAQQRMQVHATVVVREGVAYLLPAWVRRALVDEQRRWQAEGFTVVDRRLVDLDPAAGTVTVPPVGLPGWVAGQQRPDDAIGARLAKLGIAHRNEPAQPSGVLPIGGWVLPAGERTLAGRVIEAAAQVVDRSAHDGVGLLRGLAVLFEELPDVTWSTAEEVRRSLVSDGEQ